MSTRPLESYSAEEVLDSMSQATVKSLARYLIKGCAGEFLDEVNVSATGLKDDRRTMLVYADGRFVSQREPGNMILAQIHPVLDSDNLLRVTAPNIGELHVQLTTDGTPFSASVHKTSDIQVVDQGVDAAKWFSQVLGKDVRLVQMSPDYQRQVSQRWSDRPTDEVLFADGYPILLTSKESLADLNDHLPKTLTMDRFRSNIVIEGGKIPYGEELLRAIRIGGGVDLELIKLCTRCVVPSGYQIGELAGTRDKREGMAGEPLKTLMKYRRIELKTGDVGGVFGQNVIPIRLGKIRVGQNVQALETQAAPQYMMTV